MICAIHQPNFFPWYGYFNKILNSDIFVFLDKAYNSKSTKLFKSNKILVQKQETNITIPIGAKEIPINKIELKDNKWKKKHLNLLKEGYKKSKYFEQLFNIILSIYSQDITNISQFNIKLIKEICKNLRIGTKMYIESELDKDFGNKNERNMNICKHFNCNIYLSGNGAKAYNNEKIFYQNKIKLIYQEVKYLEYEQNTNKFIPNLSIIDMIFNLGFEETSKLIKFNCMGGGESNT